MTDTEPTSWLIPLSGPALEPLQISGRKGGVTLGRGQGAELRLPITADVVSRQHFRVARGGDGRWFVADLGSRWGTYLNGVKLPPQREVPIDEGDLLRVAPWTFHFSVRAPRPGGLLPDDDARNPNTLIRPFEQPAGGAARPLADDLLALLLESAASLHSAANTAALGQALVDAALRGSGLTHAAFLRPLDAAGRVEVLAAKPTGVEPRFSRSLIAAASGGVTAELSSVPAADVGHSIVQLGITSALCVPLMLGGAVAAYLYLHSRTHHRPSPGAASFCLALGRMASLALANLKRIEIEKRQAAIEFDLAAAAAAQKWMLPPRKTSTARLTCTGESRAGAYVGGDFFDVMVLDDDRVAGALGDVSGHGVAASLLMTAAQGFLHAAMRQAPDVAAAVKSLDRFIIPRRSSSSFMTLWVGVFDVGRGTLAYVNAGHGYAMLARPGGAVEMLDGGDGLPIGCDEDAAYHATVVPLPANGKVLVVSDGLVEQYGRAADNAERQFGIDRVKAILAAARPDGDVVAALFDAVIDHARPHSLQDDATALVVDW